MKQHESNTGLFRNFCKDNDDGFETVAIHTEVLWLSKENCLVCFLNLFPTVIVFLDGQAYEEYQPTLADNNLITQKHNIAYLTDILRNFET